MRIMLAVLLASALWAGPALAYIDPGSGSYLFQLLIAGAVGALYGLKVFWRQIRSGAAFLFGRRRKSGDG